MKIKIKILFTFCVLLVCSFGTYAQDFNCERLKENETTRQGYSETVIYKLKEKFQTIRGTTVLSSVNEPLDGVFVELFSGISDKRIFGCRTDVTGKFNFPNIPNGKYTLRLSKDGGFAISEIQFKVSTKSKNKNELVGFVHLGT